MNLFQPRWTSNCHSHCPCVVFWSVVDFYSVFDPHFLSSYSCLVLQFLMWSCSFGLRTTSLGFIFWQTYFFSEFGNFLHVHFQSFCHFEISKIIVFSPLESLVPMWLEKFWILKGCSHFYWALNNHCWFWLYPLVRISSFTTIRSLL